jgi:hypothetical protein
VVAGSEVVTFAASVAAWPKDRGRLAEGKGLPISTRKWMLKDEGTTFSSLLKNRENLGLFCFGFELGGGDRDFGPRHGMGFLECLCGVRLGGNQFRDSDQVVGDEV